MKHVGKFIPAMLSVFLITLMISCGKTEQQNEGEMSAEKQPTSEEQITRDRKPIEVNVSVLQDIKRGDVFEISVKDEKKVFTLQTRRVQESIPGLLSVSANIENRDTGLATLVLRDGRLNGMLELYKENTKYKVGYDSVSASHYIQEMETDEMEGSEPRTPPFGQY